MTDNADSTFRRLDAVNLESRPQPLHSLAFYCNPRTPSDTTGNPAHSNRLQTSKGKSGDSFVDLYHGTG
jgi:hypothetical protein